MDLLKRAKAALFEVIDPELGVNIMDLGLIYGVIIDENNNATIQMTLTTPGCPMSESIQNGVKYRIKMINGINDVAVLLTFDPPWTPERMTDRCKAFLSR